MISITRIDSPDAPGMDVFFHLGDAALRSSRSLFIAESPNVIQRALERGFEPVALLCEEGFPQREDGARLLGMLDAGANHKSGSPVIYSAAADVLSAITGYHLTRGAICAFRRPVPTRTPLIEWQLATAPESGLPRRIAVLDGIVDAANVGAIFRSAAALGAGAVLLTHTCCDPLNRRAIRASMGAVFQIPWGWLEETPATHRTPVAAETPAHHRIPVAAEIPAASEPLAVASLRKLGFRTVAMALRSDSISLDSPVLAAEEHLSILLGNEGQGLPEGEIAAADYVVRIPMQSGADSLNVAAAAAIALWQLLK